jgi:hypothetical protein
MAWMRSSALIVFLARNAPSARNGSSTRNAPSARDDLWIGIICGSDEILDSNGPSVRDDL